MIRDVGDMRPQDFPQAESGSYLTLGPRSKMPWCDHILRLARYPPLAGTVMVTALPDQVVFNEARNEGAGRRPEHVDAQQMRGTSRIHNQGVESGRVSAAED
jgi:hypothetical protein